MTAPSPDHVPMVRCRLNGSEEHSDRNRRYIPLAEFGLWRYLMETKHGRQVAVDEVSVWITEEAARGSNFSAAEDLEPVLRLRFEGRGVAGMQVIIERYFPAETYPEAQQALLRHFAEVSDDDLVACPGYFVPARARKAQEAPTLA